MNPMGRMKSFASVFCAASLLGACASQPPLRLYDGPERPLAEMAQIVKMDSYDATGNRLSYDWISRVDAVNGRSTNGHGRTLVPPGQYTVTMHCEVNPRLQSVWKGGRKEVVVNAKVGEVYYPWCDMQASLIRGPATAGAIAGTIVGSVASGQAQPYLSTRRVP